MVDFRTALAVVLGAGLGLVLIAFPELVIRVHTVGRVPNDRGGQYGDEAAAPDSWRRVVQAIGVVLVLIAGYIWI